MHYSRIALAAVPVFATAALADSFSHHDNVIYNPKWGKAIIENKCDEAAYLWEDLGVFGAPMQKIAPGGSISGPLYQTHKAGAAGPSIKLAVAGEDGQPPSLFTNTPITQFEYTVDAPNWPNAVSFDGSNVDGKGNPPFTKGGLTLTCPQDPSKTKICKPGENPCQAFYTNPTDDQQAMLQTDESHDIKLILCGPSAGGSTGGGGDGGNEHPKQEHKEESSPPKSSPPPVVTPPVVENKIKKPSPVQEEPHTKIVMVTEYAPAAVVTKIVPFHEHKEKREEHIHQHAHAHQKINKRRHGA